MVKIRKGFVSNSSSSSFVLVKEEMTEEEIKIVLDSCHHTTIESLDDACDNDWPELYNVVEYQDSDPNIHVWVRRDECMCNDELDDILEKYDGWDENTKNIDPKYDRHY